MAHVRNGREAKEARRATANVRAQKGTPHNRTKAHRLGRCNCTKKSQK